MSLQPTPLATRRLDDDGEGVVFGNDTLLATRRLDEDERGIAIVNTLGGPQEVTIINESGLYKDPTTAVRSHCKGVAKRYPHP